MAKIPIRVQGRRVLVDEKFKDLPRSEQDSIVAGIAASFEEKSGPETSAMGAFGRGAIDMASFGFDDEIAATVKSIVSGDYDTNVAEYRRGKETARREHPYAYTGGQAAGGVATAFVPGLNIAKAATLPGMMGRGLISGALSGEAYGIGSGEGDLMERLPGASDDALAGAAAGVVAPPLLRGAEALLRGAGRGARAVGSRVAPGLVQSNASKDAAYYVAESLKDTAGSVDNALQEAAQLDVPVGFGNVSTRGRTASEINRMVGPEKQKIFQNLDDLLNEKKSNIGIEARQATNGPAMNPYVFKDRYVKNIKDAADSVYNKIWSSGEKPSPRVNGVAFNVLRKSKEVRNMVKSALPPGTKFNINDPTLEQVEMARRALKELGGGSDSRAAFYRSQERILREALDEDHKNLAGVRKIWGDTYAMDEGFEAGTKGIKRNSQMVEKEYMDLPEAARPLWRKGMYSDIQHQLEDNAEDSIGGLKRFTHTPGGARVLDLVSEGNSGGVTKAIDQFEAVADVDKAVRRGSHTSRLDQQNAMGHLRPASFAGWAMQNIAQGNWGGAVSHLAAAAAYLPKAMREMSPAAKAEALRLMTSRDRATVERALRAFAEGSAAEKEIFRRQLENLFTQAVRGAAVGVGD